MSGFPHQPWSDQESYDYLKNVDRADLAWEWLRRNADYRQQSTGRRRRASLGLQIALAPAACIARWGCLCVEAPERRATDASMLWTSALDLSVLRVAAFPCPSHDTAAFDLRQWGGEIVIIIGTAGREHVLLRGRSNIRLDVIAGTLRDGPVSLRFDMTEAKDVEKRIQTLRRFLHCWKTGDASPLPRARNGPSRRAIDALRVHDAMNRGASIRDIGVMLFGQARIDAEWRSPGESLKSHCRRLIAHAHHMASEGYRKLLS